MADEDLPLLMGEIQNDFDLRNEEKEKEIEKEKKKEKENKIEECEEGEEEEIFVEKEEETFVARTDDDDDVYSVQASPSPSKKSMTISSPQFYDQYHGHPSMSLSLLLSSLRQWNDEETQEEEEEVVIEKDQNEESEEKREEREEKRRKERSCIFLAGDSSLDNKHWVYRPLYHHTQKAFYDDENVGQFCFNFLILFFFYYYYLFVFLLSFSLFLLSFSLKLSLLHETDFDQNQTGSFTSPALNGYEKILRPPLMVTHTLFDKIENSSFIFFLIILKDFEYEKKKK